MTTFGIIVRAAFLYFASTYLALAQNAACDAKVQLISEQAQRYVKVATAYDKFRTDLIVRNPNPKLPPSLADINLIALQNRQMLESSENMLREATELRSLRCGADVDRTVTPFINSASEYIKTIRPTLAQFEALRSQIQQSPTSYSPPAPTYRAQQATTYQTGWIRYALLGCVLSSALMIVLGMTNRVVVFMDEADVALNALPFGIILFGGMAAFGFFYDMLPVALSIVALTAIGLIIFNFYRSLQYNSFLHPLANIGVALIKTIFSVCAVFVLLSAIGRIKEEGIRVALIWFLGIGLIAAVVAKLINGPEVLARVADRHELRAAT